MIIVVIAVDVEFKICIYTYSIWNVKNEVVYMYSVRRGGFLIEQYFTSNSEENFCEFFKMFEPFSAQAFLSYEYFREKFFIWPNLFVNWRILRNFSEFL